MEDTISVSVELDSRSYDTSTPDPSDSWGRASTCTTWNFRGLRRSRKDEKPNWRGSDVFEIPKEWIGKTVFVVWIVWSDGDSFGHDEGRNAEGLGVYATYEEASAVKKMILDDYKNSGYDYSMKKGANQITLPSGQVLSTYTWKGYFESLDDVHIDEALVKSYVGD